MARPDKLGLDYFPFDIDFFEDEKIEAISGEFGLKGEMAVIRLLCAVYRNGYFIVWTEMLKMKLLKCLPGVSDELLEQIVNRLVRWGFFDKTLFDSVRVLTSKGIQRRYFNIVRRRKNITVDKTYILIQPEMGKGVNVDNNEVNVYRNSSSTEFLSAKTPQIKLNQIKSNERKENVSSSLTRETAAVLSDEEKKEFFEIFFFRNFQDPAREVERFIAWNGKQNKHPTKYDAELWNPEVKEKRFSEGFIKAWKALYTTAKFSGPDGEDVAAHMLDNKLVMKAVNGKWQLQCPEKVAAWLNDNQETAAEMLKPALRGYPLGIKTYRI